MLDIDAAFWLATYPDFGDDSAGIWRPPPATSDLSVSRSDLLPEHPAVALLHFGSPFHLLLEVPWAAWASGGTVFIGALTAVFGLPWKAAARYQAAREEFWTQRLSADEAKHAWLEAVRARNMDAELQEMSASQFDVAGGSSAAPQ